MSSIPRQKEGDEKQTLPVPPLMIKNQSVIESPTRRAKDTPLTLNQSPTRRMTLRQDRMHSFCNSRIGSKMSVDDGKSHVDDHMGVRESSALVTIDASALVNKQHEHGAAIYGKLQNQKLVVFLTRFFISTNRI